MTCNDLLTHFLHFAPCSLFSATTRMILWNAMQILSFSSALNSPIPHFTQIKIKSPYNGFEGPTQPVSPFFTFVISSQDSPAQSAPHSLCPAPQTCQGKLVAKGLNFSTVPPSRTLLHWSKQPRDTTVTSNSHISGLQQQSHTRLAAGSGPWGPDPDVL